jgi:DNA-binding transcriptional LysR family regulator
MNSVHVVMNDTDIRRLDMTLLLVLSSLLRTRQATATAQQLGVTQSSVSHSLAKLREIFADELFLRRPQGLLPTARARALQPVVDGILDMTRGAVRTSAFDPRTAEGLVRIAGTDYPCTLLAAPLIERLEAAAPGLRVSFRPLVRDQAMAALLAGDLDFAIGPFAADGERFARRPLWEDDYLVAVRKGHPAFRSACTLAGYCAGRHVLVSLAGDLDGIVDRALAARGKLRTVVASTPYFLTALATVARSDAIATVPASIARAHADALALRLFPCPVPIRSLKVSLVHRRGGGALIEWCAGVIADVARAESLGVAGDVRRRGRTKRA